MPLTLVAVKTYNNNNNNNNNTNNNKNISLYSFLQLPWKHYISLHKHTPKIDKHSQALFPHKFMCSFMPEQCVTTGKLLYAQVTSERFLSCVYSLVDLQVILLCKRLGTYFAVEWFFPLVCPLMSAQGIPAWKALGAHLTVVWFFSCVCPLVDFDVILLGQLFTT